MEGDLVKKSHLLDVFGGLSSRMKECVEVFESKAKEVTGREEELDLREKRLEERERKLKGEIEVGKKRLEEMGKRTMELDLMVDSLESLVQDHEEVLEEKEKLFGEMKKRVAEKEKELVDLESSVVDRGKRLELLEMGLKEKSAEIEANAKELISVLGNLMRFGEELKIKERQSEELQCVIDDRMKEVQVIEERLRYCHSSIEKCDREIVAKEEKLKSVQSSLLERSKELETRQKQFYFALVSEFETRKTNLDGSVKELELELEVVESRIEELDSIQKKCDEDIKELESKEKEFCLLQREVEASSRELELKGARYEKRVTEFKVRQKRFDSIRQSTRRRVREKTNALQSRVTNEPMEYSITTSDSVDGKYLLSVLSHHLETSIAINSHIYAVFEVASDPAKLVLDVMEEFYPSSSSREGEANDLSISRASCIILLGMLMEAAPDINPQVKEEAMKLATNWKDKLKVASGNSLEVVGYMQLLASYRLAFQEDEIRSLLDFLGDEKQASKILEAFLIAVNAPVKGLGAENSMAKTLSSFIELQSGSTTGGRNFDWFLIEDITKNVARQNDIFAMVQKFSNPAELLLKIMEGSFSQHWRTEDLCLKVTVLKNCIFLLEKLSRSLPQIQPPVKEAAEKFAFWWKAKMRENTENYPLELLSFVQFLHIYQLISSFSQCEISNFLVTISEDKPALDVCSCLQLANKIPVYVKTLVDEKKFLEAVKLICCFNLTVKFSLRELLNRCVEDVKSNSLTVLKDSSKSEEKAADKEIDDLRGIFQCIRTYDLDAFYPASKIKKHIEMLESFQRGRRCQAEAADTLSSSEIEKEREQRRNKRGHGISGPVDLPQQGRSKFPRGSPPASRNVPLYVPTAHFVPVTFVPVLGNTQVPPLGLRGNTQVPPLGLRGNTQVPPLGLRRNTQVPPLVLRGNTQVPPLGLRGNTQVPPLGSPRRSNVPNVLQMRY